MFTIYRVEISRGPWQGDGPYSQWSEWGDDNMLLVDNGPDHPRPMDEGLHVRYGRDYCGFASHAQFAAWFGPANLRRMRDLGFGVSVYRADPTHVQLGRCQLVFDRAQAHKVDTIDIVDFLEHCGVPETEPDDQRYVSTLTVPGVALHAMQNSLDR